MTGQETHGRWVAGTKVRDPIGLLHATVLNSPGPLGFLPACSPPVVPGSHEKAD